MLQSCGANVIVAMTVTRANCADIAAMVAKYGSHLTVQPLFKAGRASMADDLALIGVEYYRALAAVEGVAPMGAVSAKLKSLRGRGVRRCAMTEREISIAETGDMYPCQLLHEERFRGGEGAGAIGGRDLFRFPCVYANAANQRGCSGEMLSMRSAISMRQSVPRSRSVRGGVGGACQRVLRL